MTVSALFLSMENFRDELNLWFDQCGFMGRRVGARAGEEGNPLTETGTAYLIAKKLKQSRLDDAEKFSKAVLHLTLEPGLYAHKLLGDESKSTDELTHDDIIGVVAGARAVDSQEMFHVEHFGRTHGWNFKNTPNQFYTAYAKPWHIAFYQLAAGVVPSAWDYAMLVGSVLLNAFTAMDDASGKRLTWLMLESIDTSKFLFLNLAKSIWKRRILSVYGGMKRIFIMYHGEKHVFSRYFPENVV